MAYYEKQVRDKLTENGCYFLRRGKGDHDIWFSPITKVPITIDSKTGRACGAEGLGRKFARTCIDR